MKSRLKIALILSVAVMLGSCGKPKEAHSDLLKRYALMQLVFGRDTTAHHKNIYPLSITTNEMTASQTGTQTEIQRAQVTPVYVVKLDKAIMLTTDEAVDNDDKPIECHACGVFLGAYFFTQDDDGWKLTRRQDDVSTLGIEGNPGHQQRTDQA